MKLNKKNARNRNNHHSPKDINTVKHLDNISSNTNCDNSTIIVLYDCNQQTKTLGITATIFKQFIFTSVSLNVIARLIYYYIIKSEAEKLFEDIKRVKKRFASNTYSRISNELNIFILNSIEINSSHGDSPHCFLAGSTKYLLSQQSSSSPNMISELISDVFEVDYEYFNLDFFSQVYIHSLKQTISLGASLDTLKKFVVPYKDLIYDPHEKNNLRGAHSQLQDLRTVYNQKMKSQYTFNEEQEQEGNNSQEALQKFTEKLQKLITNPDLMMCNHISSQNSINIKNFKQNFINVNQIAIKDLYNNVLDTTDGLISMRVQNSISKSFYLLCFLTAGFILVGLFRKIRKLL